MMHSGCSRPLLEKDSDQAINQAMDQKGIFRMKRSLSAALLLLLIAGCSRERPAHSGGKPSTPGSGTAPAAGSRTQSGAAEVGTLMPPYSGKLLDGSDFQVGNLKGKVVLINVWATWCGPCRFEIPELESLHKQHAGSGLKVIGISVDEGGEASVTQFVTDQKMTYSVALDPEGRIANLLQTTVLPTTILVDRNGKIVWRQVGAVAPGDAKLRSALNAALGIRKV